MANLQIRQFPCLDDNYGVLIHDPEADVTAAIDAPEVAAIDRALTETGWRLTHILNTHHHRDHTGGNLELQKRSGCTIVGPRDEAEKIPGLQTAVGDGESCRFGTHDVRVIATPGHTLGHIAYHFTEDMVAFVGDTLFALGCGRVFEGTPAQMWSSLCRLMELPAETMIHCGHEYTQANARFALTIEPDNTDLVRRAAEIDRMREAGKATVPMKLSLELATNPFLRAGIPSVQANLGMAGADPADVFAEIRRRKDNF